MLFNLNEFLISISFALDFAEMDVLGNRSNHSKRVAYISYQIGKELLLSKEELFDLISLSILHDNAISESISQENHKTAEPTADPQYGLIHKETLLEHCIHGEDNIHCYPFYTDVKNAIRYHHENYDGTGFFKQKGEETPLMAQIIHFADKVDNFTYLPNLPALSRNLVIDFVKQSTGSILSPYLANAFYRTSKHPGFWLDLKNEFIDFALKKHIPSQTMEVSLEKIYDLTKIYSNLIDLKSKFTQNHSSGLAKKAEFMAGFYHMDKETTYRFMIAASLHDIGKLAINNSILDKPGKLNYEETTKIQTHTYYTRISLSQITGFEDITEWAANHHEKLDGSGYPFGLMAKELDFHSRLMACLDICQALTEERPYRHPSPAEKVADILNRLADSNKLDQKIVLEVISCLNQPGFLNQ